MLKLSILLGSFCVLKKCLLFLLNLTKKIYKGRNIKVGSDFKLYFFLFPSLERFFEDHENVIEVLSHWTRDSENKILFLEKNEKYAVFKNPQVK